MNPADHGVVAVRPGGSALHRHVHVTFDASPLLPTVLTALAEALASGDHDVTDALAMLGSAVAERDNGERRDHIDADRLTDTIALSLRVLLEALDEHGPEPLVTLALPRDVARDVAVRLITAERQAGDDEVTATERMRLTPLDGAA